MKMLRELVPETMDGWYRVMNRAVERGWNFGDAERARFRALVLDYAGFSGIDVAAWCMLEGEFHLLVRVPSRRHHDPAKLPAEEVLRRLSLIYPTSRVLEVRRDLAAAESEKARRDILEPYTRRMGDLGKFLRVVKQSFSLWCNQRHGRKGTLWEDRYSSEIVAMDAGDREHPASTANDGATGVQGLG